MAGRGTDIMLGGNAEFLAKNQMRKEGYYEELIVEATGFGDTDNEEGIIEDANALPRLSRSSKKNSVQRQTRFVKQAVCSSLVPSVMNPDVSTTSCADVPDVRATLAAPVSTSLWKMI